MVNTIVDGVTATLGGAFPNYEIYTENIKQGLTEPCFFVLPLEPNQTPLLNNRYLISVPFNVHYFPAEGYAEINDVAAKLFNLFRRITLVNGDTINGQGLRYEIIDNVLHFFVTYKTTVLYPVEAEENMETKTIKTKTN